MFEEEYEESKVVLREMIKAKCPSDAWVVSSDAWLQRITTRIQEYYDDYNHNGSPSFSEPNDGQSSTVNKFRFFMGMMLTSALAFAFGSS